MKSRNRFFALILILAASFEGSTAFALDLDWSGQFRAESHLLLNSTMDEINRISDSRLGAGGYYIPGRQATTASFQTLFLRLRPTVVVNDNVYIKSEWWAGNPVFGMFGDAAPYTTDQRQFYSTQSRGSLITAQRFWAELLTEVGTLQVGRAPLHYGLGIFWNSGGGLFDRYMSTGDAIRLLSKFGSFTVAPGIIKHSIGNSIGGNCPDPGSVEGNTGVCNTVAAPGHGNVTDYTLTFQYENLEEQINLGLLYLKRVIGSVQDNSQGYLGTQGRASPASSNYQIWDIFVDKDLGPVKLAAELPIGSGVVGGLKYKTWALALESKYQATDRLSFSMKAGRAPGQQNSLGAANVFRAFYFNPAYRLGLLMFNYNLRAFAGPNTLNNPGTPEQNLQSPFDNPIVNARYLSLNGSYDLAKWAFRAGGVIADAVNTASEGSTFFNTWDRRFYTAVANQNPFLGWEMDYGVSYKWDDNFIFNFDFGVYFPGAFYSFSNTTTQNQPSTIFGFQTQAGIRF